MKITELLTEEWRDHISGNKLKTIEKFLERSHELSKALNRFSDMDQGAAKALTKKIAQALDELQLCQMSVDKLEESVLTEAAGLAPMVIINVEDGGGQDYYEGARDALKQLGYHDQGTVLDFIKKLKDAKVKDMQYYENFGVFAPKKPTPEAVRAHLKIKN